MEKRAIVEAGRTPSELSGRHSIMVKNGVAIASGEHPPDNNEEAELAKNMATLYNHRKAQ